ncbi:hypothetical protein AX15_005699 [Amanita polypyramis BW_CC]|nr:hypothetical protein AX15_005699 [Amanita polypyramis BW_CC]
MRTQFQTSKPNPVNIQHTQLGVWDLYEELNPSTAYLPGWSASLYETYLELVQSLPYLLRMVKDVIGIKTCWILLFTYFTTRLLLSLIPATELWFSGQLLSVGQTALDEHMFNKDHLIQVAAGSLLCSVSNRFLTLVLRIVEEPLNRRIKQFYTIHYFHAMARLDLPTFEDAAVQQQFEKALPRSSKYSIAWDTVMAISNTGFKSLTLVSQLVILIRVLREQRDGLLFAVPSFVYSVMSFSSQRRFVGSNHVWAAITKDPHYIRTEGLKRTVNDGSHRKEIVAGNLWKYMLAQYTQGVEQIADRAGDFYDVLAARHTWDSTSFINTLIKEPIQHLPQVIFTLRAVQYPTSVPLMFASLNLVTKTTNDFAYTIFSLVDNSDSIMDRVASIRNLYEIIGLPNKIPDGTVPYPENQRSLEMGMSIEFRNVTFKYPDTDNYALRDVSFKIEKGQLCVLIGVNGSGKSTILKLIARIYDTTEGQILIDSVDIRTLRLDDLRRTISVLFQDYTHFPLSIRDNIGLGDPEHANDDDKILEAARLGGADEIIRHLPEGLDTYLERPVRDYYSGLTEGKTLFGRPVDYNGIRRRAGMDSSTSKALSGGQMQRIALARTFMRSLTPESRVGLLLFDEPSASLDPTAEHELFERLRHLRGHKTMIFSSHRFGNLTRHADIILYMNDSMIAEKGTHGQLLERDGEYARIWKLQAQAFI